MPANETYIGSPDNPRTTAVVSYITFIGWIVAYFFLYRGQTTNYSAFHLRQSLLIHIISFLLKLAFSFNVPPNRTLDIVLIATGTILFVLWLLGFLNAINGKEKPVPVIGKLAQFLFSRL